MDILSIHVNENGVPWEKYLEKLSNQEYSDVKLGFIISDIAHSLNESFYGDNNDVTDIYAKLFYGSNLPCINTSGEEYIPVWDAQELEKLNKVFRSGISILSEKCGFQLDS